MNKHNFDKVVGYIWQGANYTYSEATGALGRIATMLNPDKLNGVEIYCHPNFLAMTFLWVIIGPSLIFMHPTQG